MKKLEPGIYCILNLLTQKVYIGQSIKVKKRIRKHLYLLKREKHENPEYGYNRNDGSNSRVSKKHLPLLNLSPDNPPYEKYSILGNPTEWIDPTIVWIDNVYGIREVYDATEISDLMIECGENNHKMEDRYCRGREPYRQFFVYKQDTLKFIQKHFPHLWEKCIL